MNRPIPFVTRHAVIGCLTLALLTSSCTTHTSRTEAQGTGLGALGGAAAGAVIGKQIGGDRAGLVAGALIGAVIGAAIGHSWAERVEEARKKYQSEEERLAATIRVSTRIQEELVKENKKLTERVERSRAGVKKLLADYDAKKVTKDRLVSEQKDLEAKRVKAQEARVDLEKAIATEEEALAAARKASLAAASTLEQAIVAQRKELAKLQQLEAELVSLAATMSV